MSSITYRALDPNNDPMRGQGQANFLTDADAVGQAIRTRLLLFEGEWWADLSDGTPWWQSILGTAGGQRLVQTVSLAIQSRILGTPFVTGIQNLQASFDSAQRKFDFYAEVQTQFGVVVVQNIPTPPSRRLPS